jgi:hypothetical protein
LLGLSADRAKRVSPRNPGTKVYHWTNRARPMRRKRFGDQRINPFGVGAEG